MRLVSFTIVVMLVFCANFAGALEEGRPLRSVPPEFSESMDSMFPIYHSQRAHNSLITARALSQPLTQRFIAQYSSTHGIATLNAVISRGSIYLPFIREEVARRGLPPELVYLPIIESGFLITARSRSGAMGLWQFMMNSIGPYDMRVTEYIDERRDFIKSTRGALQKLEDEYRRLGCWELTLAAYNSGINAVLRSIQRTGINDYWELSRRGELRPETINFVPRLIAAAYVVSQPRRFDVFKWHERFEWVDIPLRRQVSLDIIADETGIDRDLMRRLNAELIHGISPRDPGYRLKIPLSHYDQVVRILESDDLPLIRYYYHVVRQGDTLWGMSRHYGVSLSMIEQHNPGISSRHLRIGETVVVPAFSLISPPATMTSAPATSPQGFNGTHVVQRGETFWSLGIRYGVEAAALAAANGMQLNQTLHEGRTLRVPIIQ